jgi:single-strand DNA-binding protein
MANFNFNKVILGGRLTADPELKTTPSGVSVTTFTVAVNRRSAKEAADFLTVTAWRATAEFITRYFRKASSICVVGSLQTRSWTDQQGQKRFATDIVADEAFFVDALRESPFGRNSSDVTVDPSSPAMAGAGTTGEKMPEQVYATSDARAGIESGMSEGDEPLPF